MGARREQVFLKGDNYVNNLLSLSAVMAARGQRDSALYYNQLALIAGCQAFNSPDLFDLPAPEDFGDWTIIYHVLSAKSELFRQAAAVEEDADLQQRYFDAAYRAIDLADAVHQKNLERLNLLRGGKTRALMLNVFTPYGSGLAAAHQRFQQTGAVEDAAKGFYYTQRMKAQRLWLSLLNSEATEFGNLDRSILEEERSLRVDISHYEDKIMDAKQRRDTAAVLKYRNDHLFHKKEALTALQRTLEEDYPDYFEAKYAFEPETAATLREVISEEELLVEYIFTDSALFVFTVAADQPLQFRSIAIDDQTVEEVETFQKMLQNSAMRRQSSREKFIRLSHRLYRQFVEPIEDQLAGKKRLLIIGDGMVNYVPFDVLLPRTRFRLLPNWTT